MLMHCIPIWDCIALMNIIMSIFICRRNHIKMADEDEVLFDDVYELYETIGK